MLYEGRKAALPLNFVVVGGGVGGLAVAHCLNQAGHKVTVIDIKELPAEMGAGVTLSPNATRLLYRWGLKPQLEAFCAKPEWLYACRNDTDEQVSCVPYANPPDDDARFYGVYHPFLVNMLYDLVKENVIIVKGKVVSVDPETPSVTLESGETLTGDVIVGADGIGSVVRPTIIPEPDPPVLSGDMCYRSVISVDDIRRDPELDSVRIDDLYLWKGQDKRLIAYGVGNGFYNLVIVINDTDPNGPWSIQADLAEVQAVVAGWTPRAAKMTSLIRSALKFKVVMRIPADKWVHDSGKVAILGDAAHAMLPYYAQGTAMAIEDAAVLGNLFSRISSRGEVGELLKIYQDLRVPRSSATHAKSLENGNLSNVADAWLKTGGIHSALPAFVKAAEQKQQLVDWLNKKVFTENATQYGYDADKVVEEWWAGNWET